MGEGDGEVEGIVLGVGLVGISVGMSVVGLFVGDDVE